MSRIFLYSIRLYRRYLSPLFPPSCRFVPTCSEYALEAFKTQRPGKALFMTVVRIVKCHPFHPGGYDPVYPVREKPLYRLPEGDHHSLTR